MLFLFAALAVAPSIPRTHRMKRFPPACLDGWEHLKDVHTVPELQWMQELHKIQQDYNDCEGISDGLLVRSW